MISERSEGHVASKMGVAVGGGMVAVGRTVGVSVGRGVGVSGRINLVAARQANVERRSGSVHKNNLSTEWVRIEKRPLSSP